MIKIRIVTIVALILSTSLHLCAQEKKKQSIFKNIFGVSVNESYDKFEGTTTFQMNGNKVFSELSGANALVNLVFGSEHVTFNTFLNLEKHVSKDGSYDLAILFKVEADNEILVRVREGESLIFLLDDERIDLSTTGSFNTDYDMLENSSVANARYPITKDILTKINNSASVEFRIMLDSHQSGEADERDRKNQHLDGRFTKKNKKVWKEFYQDYVINDQKAE